MRIRRRLSVPANKNERLRDRPSRRATLYAGAALLIALTCAAAAQAQGFRFSTEEQKRKAAEANAAAERQERVESLLSVPCLERIKDQKIMVVIGEDRNGVIVVGEALYNPHFEAINQRLRAVGLRTYTPEEIRRQIAQAQLEALLRKDVQAARAAAKRVAARYILRGLITTRAVRNPVVNVNQVSVNMDFILTASDGTLISQVSEKNESFAGRDVAGMALTLINERADEVVARLYNDYCQGAAAR
jgi:hypothetical protein